MFAAIHARGHAAGAVASTAWLQAMLDVEAALATACAEEELVDAATAERIAAACRAERFDRAALERQAGEHATPVVGLVAALREAVGPEDAAAVHLGATSQDVLDTALALVAHRAGGHVRADAAAAAEAAARLAAEHRATPMLGRTLLQPALPTTFGLRAAGWAGALDHAAAALGGAGLPVQMGGPVGTREPAVGRRVAAALGLRAPVLPWPTDRTPVAELAAALGVLAGVLGKVALDVVLLAQGEVAEVAEGGGGRSSAMAHKRNPATAVAVRACAARTPGLVATVLAGLPQELDRAAGAWQAEWATVSELLVATGSAAAWGRELLEELVVDPGRMRENLARADVADLDPQATERAAALVDRALAARG